MTGKRNNKSNSRDKNIKKLSETSDDESNSRLEASRNASVHKCGNSDDMSSHDEETKGKNSSSSTSNDRKKRGIRAFSKSLQTPYDKENNVDNTTSSSQDISRKRVKLECNLFKLQTV